MSRPLADCPVHPKGRLGYLGLNPSRDTHLLRCLVDECGHIVAWPVDASQHSRKNVRNGSESGGGLRDRAHGGATSLESRMSEHSATEGS